MISTAVISDCGKFRYRLGRRWQDGGLTLLFIMLNPSIADANIDDPTIRRCIGFAKSHGYSALEVVNLFAYRATDPVDLKINGWQVGSDNDHHIQQAMRECSKVCVAWGSHAKNCVQRCDQVARLISECNHVPMALAVDSNGIPRHPLMLRSNLRMQRLSEF